MYLWKDSAIEQWRKIYLYWCEKLLATGRTIGMSSYRKKDLAAAKKRARTKDWNTPAYIYTEFEFQHAERTVSRVDIRLAIHEPRRRKKHEPAWEIEVKVNFPTFGEISATEAIRYGTFLTVVGELGVMLRSDALLLGLDPEPVDPVKDKTYEARLAAAQIRNSLKPASRRLFEDIMAAARKRKGKTTFLYCLTTTQRRLLAPIKRAGLVTIDKGSDKITITETGARLL